MIETKADRVCSDTELNINRMYQLSASREREGPDQGEPSGVNQWEESQPEPMVEGPLEEGEPVEDREPLEEEPLEEEEPIEEGKPNEHEEPEAAMEPMEESLPDPSLAEPEVQVESDIEMWEARREPPTYIEISSGHEEEDWGFDYDMYGCGDEFVMRWSDEKDFVEENEEAPANDPRGNDSESEEAFSDFSSDSWGDEDDEDFNLASYDERTDTNYA